MTFYNDDDNIAVELTVKFCGLGCLDMKKFRKGVGLQLACLHSSVDIWTIQSMDIFLHQVKWSWCHF